MTPDDSKFLAEVEAREIAASPGPWKNGKLVWASWSDQVCETSEEADRNDNFAMNARADIPRLLTIIAERDAEIARHRDHFESCQADKIVTLKLENDRLRKMVEVGRAQLEKAERFVYRAKNSPHVSDRVFRDWIADSGFCGLAELDRLERGGWTAFQEIQAIVNKFFDGDAEKINAWWYTDNPLLGGLKPSAFYELRGAEKLLKHIKNWQAGEMP